jgi:glycerophosphoryl diester phosphodiesterase
VRRFRLWIVLLASLAAAAGSAVGAAPVRAVTVDVHAHRGGAGLAPENTLAAVGHALRLGVDVIELDLHVSADGTIVVIHDAGLQRTTNGRGFVRSTPLADLKQLDAGAWFNPRFAGERIPTLQEVLDVIRLAGDTYVRLNLETKYDSDGPPPPADFEESLLRLLRQAGWQRRVIIESFHYPSLERIKALDPTIKTAALRSPLSPVFDSVRFVRGAHADIYSPGSLLVNPLVVGSLHRAGIPVVPWTVNRPTAMKFVLGMGIGSLPGDGIMTDYPDRLIGVLRARGLRP